MPYLQVDLDGKRKWPMVAAGCAISEAQTCKGFLDLWEHCWREKSAAVSLLRLECLFGMPGQGARCAEVLCEFGFLELEAGAFRVCGADKYLRITEARSAGGKKASANLKRGKSPGWSRKAAGEQPESTPGSRPALTPITEHHSPSITTSTGPAAADPVASMGSLPGLEHLAAPGRRAEDKPTRTKGEKAPDTRFQPLKEKLVAAIEGHTKTKYGWQGGDATAVKKLIGFGADEEILRRLGNGLKATGYAHTSTISQLASKWNEPTVATGIVQPARAGNARFYAEQDADKSAFAKTGTLNEF